MALEIARSTHPTPIEQTGLPPGIRVSARNSTDERPVDPLADLVMVRFNEADRDRQPIHDHWSQADAAYRGEYFHKTSSFLNPAKKRGLYVPLVRRKVDQAVIKLNQHLFEQGRIPITVRTSRHYDPKTREFYQFLTSGGMQHGGVMPSSSAGLAPGGPSLEEIHQRAADHLRNELQDILELTDYARELEDSTYELALYGTCILKSPIYRTVASPQVQIAPDARVQMVREYPGARRVSCWDCFPSPGADSKESLEYLIQYKFLHRSELARWARSAEGVKLDVVREVLRQPPTLESVNSTRVRSQDARTQSRNEKRGYAVYEYWGDLEAEQVLPYLEEQADAVDQLSGLIPVCLTVCNGRVLRALIVPEGQERIPFHFAWWRRNPDSIWGDGIHWQLDDLQDLTNYLFSLVMDAKDFSSVPMAAILKSALDPQEDLEVRKGKVWTVRENVGDVRSALNWFVAPDASGGLMELIEWLSRQADMITGLSPIGLGQSERYQTQTATGMSLLDANNRTAIADVVKSISRMVSDSLNRIYRSLIEQGTDPQILGDFELQCGSYQGYINQIMEREQLQSFVAVMGALPMTTEILDWKKISAKMTRSHGLDPDEVLVADEVLEQRAQERALQEQEALQQEQQQEQRSKLFEAWLKEVSGAGEAERSAELERYKHLLEKGFAVKDPDMTQRSPLMEALSGGSPNPPSLS